MLTDLEYRSVVDGHLFRKWKLFGNRENTDERKQHGSDTSDRFDMQVTMARGNIWLLQCNGNKL